MGAGSAPEPTRLYSKLTPEQHEEFSKAVIEKLRTLIGGYGELSVLAEYIAVMLQSSRPPEQIQSELEAFLQDQSQAFTDWLCKQLAKIAGHASAAAAGPPSDAKGEALLLRAVQDARQGAATAPASAAGPVASATSKPRRREKHSKHEPAAQETPARHHHRSRSRRRRRDREAGGRKKEVAVLTPSVQFLRDAYHQKRGEDEPAPRAQPDVVEVPAPAAPAEADTRWSFRADPAPGVSPFSWQAEAPPGAAPPAGASAQPPQPHGYGAPGPVSPFGAPPYGGHPCGYPGMADQRPSRRFIPKKWKVVRANTVVRVTEQLNSEEVQTLQEGEIVEQVAPAFKLKSGIIRVQIRHPSSPQFPNPIGWVTQDATAAGGPKFLEPGPEPMQRGWRPPAASPAWAPPATWRPRGPPAGPRGPPATRVGPYGYQNVTWTPSDAKATAVEAITV